MKRILLMLVVVAASMLYSTAALAAEKTPGLSEDYSQYKAFETKGEKDQCLIVAKNCIIGDESVNQRVERLNREIAKGVAVYTSEELRSFQEQLNWIYSESEEFARDRI